MEKRRWKNGKSQQKARETSRVEIARRTSARASKLVETVVDGPMIAEPALWPARVAEMRSSVTWYSILQ